MGAWEGSERLPGGDATEEELALIVSNRPSLIECMDIFMILHKSMTIEIPDILLTS